MSDTLTNLDSAVQAHFTGKHPGQLVIGWTIVAATTTEGDDGNAYDTDCPEWQPAHHSLGLLRIGQELVLNGGDEDQ